MSIDQRPHHDIPEVVVTPDSAELARMIAANRPRPYDVSQPSEVRRLLNETRGYLHTCHHKHGTDWEGRKFAMDALDALLATPTHPQPEGAQTTRTGSDEE